MANKKVDLLVVGGGVLGTFHAFHAVDRGLSVQLVERHAAPQGATVRNFGQVVPSGARGVWQTYGRRSLEIYQRVQNEFDISIRQLGTIYVASDDDELKLLHELAEINLQNGYRSELWEPEQCRKRYPQLCRDYCKGGLFFPLEMSANPRQMIFKLHQFLQTKESFQATFQANIHRIESTAAGVEVTATNGQSWLAERVIVCSGTECQQLFSDRFRASDIKVVKLQMLRLKPQPDVVIPGNVLTGLSIRRYESFSECPSWNAIKARESADSFWKRWGVHLLVKQEVDGGIILGDSHEYQAVAEDGELDYELKQSISDYFVTEMQKILRLNSWDIESAWAGFYSQTGLPQGIWTEVVDDKIHLVTGIGGKGMTTSAGFAETYLDEVLK